MEFYKDKAELMGGAILLYKTTKQKSPMWYMRLKFPSDLRKGYIVKSTKRRDFAQAASYAEQKYREIWNDLHSGVEILTNRSFSKMFEEYMLFHQTNVGLGLSNHSIDNFRYFGRYWTQFFKDKDVRSIRTVQFDKYFSWRRTYWIDGPGSKLKKMPANVAKIPSDTTLRQDRQRLNQFFEYLLTRGVITAKPKIGVLRRDTSSRRRVGKRDHFTAEEFKIIAKKLDKWVANREGVYKGAYHFYTRIVAYNFIMVSANLGTRPGETMKIRWSDIEGWDYEDGIWGQIHISIPPSRKTGSYVAVGQFNLQKYLKSLYDIHKEFFGSNPKTSDFIFKSYNGGEYKGPQKTFKNLLIEWNLYLDQDGRTRTLYSLRGYFISSMLTRGVSVHQVAKMCGTSVKQIEQHYDRTAVGVDNSALRPVRG